MLDITAFLLQESGLGNLVIFRVLRAVRLTKITKITRLSEHTSYDEEEDEPIIVKDEKGRIVSYDPGTYICRICAGVRVCVCVRVYLYTYISLF